MKNWIGILLSIVMLLSLTACGQEPADNPTEELPTESVEIIETQPETVPETVPESKPLAAVPPALTVLDGDGQELEAMLGTYSWCYDRGDGMEMGIEADSLHPLQAKEYLTPMTTTAGQVELRFDVQPQEIRVRCWSDTEWDDPDAQAETLTLTGNLLELKDCGYIYEVTARWTGENLTAEGTAHYAFYVVRHAPVYAINEEGETEEAVGYCGNTVTKILIDGEEYSFMGTDSVVLTDLLLHLNYDPALVCKCLPDFQVETEFDMTYGVSLSGYARCGDGQADLTQEQLELIRQILENQTK